MTRQKGFTLVELLIVIGIIALLISILMPALAGARGSAQRIACANQQKHIALSVIMYAHDNKGYAPVAYNSVYGTKTGYGWVNQQLRIWKYINQGKPTTGAEEYYQFICPTAKEGNREGRFTIGYNSHYLFGKDERYYKKLSSIKKQSEAMMWMDAYTLSASSYQVFLIWHQPALVTLYGYPEFRHRGKLANVAYCDGHVSPISENDYLGNYGSGRESKPQFAAFWTGK